MGLWPRLEAALGLGLAPVAERVRGPFGQRYRDSTKAAARCSAHGGGAEKPLPRAMGVSPDKVTAPTIVRLSVTSFAIRATVPSASDE